MELLFDIGNSNIVLGLYQNRKIEKTVRLNTDRKKTEDEYAVYLHSLARDYGLAENLEFVAISSVVPELTPILKKAVQIVFGKDAFTIQPGIKTGINVPGSSSGAVGADFMCGAVGVAEEYQLPAIVVDLGTATKFFLVTKEKTFLGGSILPGVQISMDALSQKTSQLPHIELMNDPELISLNTVEAMSSGIIYGTASMLEGMFARYQKQTGESTIVATGGLAKTIVRHCNISVNLDEDLVLKGLHYILHKNK